MKRLIAILLLAAASIMLLHCGEGDEIPLATIPINTATGELETTVTPLTVSYANGGDITVKITEINGVSVRIDSINYRLLLENGAEDVSRRGYFTYAMFISIWQGIPVISGNDSVSASFNTTRTFAAPTPANSTGLFIIAGTDDNSHVVSDTAFVNFQ